MKGNQTNINKIAFDLNNEKNEIKKIIKKPIRRKNTNRKIINYKKSKYNIDNYYYNFKIMSNLGRK